MASHDEPGMENDFDLLGEARRFSKKKPNVLKPPSGAYRTYQDPPGWRRAKTALKLGFGLFLLIYLFVPSSRTVTLEGRVAAREMRTLDVQVGGEVAEIFKSNGQSVAAGETVARLHNADLHREVSRLEAEIKVLEAEKLAHAQTLAAEDGIAFQYRRLAEAGDLAKLRLDRQELKVLEARNRLAVKEAEFYERTIRLANLKAKLENEVVKSPFAGVITSAVAERLHAQIREGESLCEVAFGGLRFEFAVREDAVKGIEPGQKIQTELEAFSGRRFEAVVDEIRPVVEEEHPKPWIKVYNAKVLASSLTPLPEPARIGMTTRARVRLKHKQSRLFRWIGSFQERLRD